MANGLIIDDYVVYLSKNDDFHSYVCLPEGSQPDSHKAWMIDRDKTTTDAPIV